MTFLIFKYMIINNLGRYNEVLTIRILIIFKFIHLHNMIPHICNVKTKQFDAK